MPSAAACCSRPAGRRCQRGHCPPHRRAFDFPIVGVYDHGTDAASWAGPADIPALEQRLREVARQGISLNEAGMQIVAIRLGGAPIGSLAIPDADLSDTVLQSVANLAAIGLERARGQEAAARAEVAQQSGELRATMLDALAHEFKTPLTSMKVAAADLRANVQDDRNRELAAIIEEDLDRLQSLVTDTVQMVRVDAGDFTLRPNDHSMSAIVSATLRQFEARLDGHAVVTRVPDVAVDPRRPRAARTGPAAAAGQRGQVLAADIGDRDRGDGRRDGRICRFATRARQFRSASRPGWASDSTGVRWLAGCREPGWALPSSDRSRRLTAASSPWRARPPKGRLSPSRCRERRHGHEQRPHSRRGRRSADPPRAEGHAERAGLRGRRRQGRGGRPGEASRVAFRPRAARHQHARA